MEVHLSFGGCRMKLILTVSVLAAAALPVTASAQDWSVLERPGTLDPQSTLGIETLPPGIAVPRVLLAGDSWAQFMWDDGSHNLIFDRYGHADKMAISQSAADFPTGGYNGTAYAISGSEARQWVDTGTWPFLANAVNGLNANPTIDHVMLSIGGNDFLAAKSGGGWDSPSAA